MINQVITEPELVGRSNHLEDVLANGNYEEYCRQKADQMPDQNGRYIWYFLKANFDANPRSEMLNLLGYSPEDMEAKFGKYLPKEAEQTDGIDKGIGVCQVFTLIYLSLRNTSSIIHYNFSNMTYSPIHRK